MLFEIPMIVILLQSIPEGFFITIVGLKLFNIKIQWRRAGIIAIIYGIVCYLIRKSVVIYGLHSILGLFALTLLIKGIGKVSFLCSGVSTLASFLLIGLFQIVTVPTALQIVNVSFDQLSENSILTIIAGIPTFVLMGMTYFILNKTGFYFYSLNLSKKE